MKRFALALNPDDFLYAAAVDRLLAKNRERVVAVYIFPVRTPFRKHFVHMTTSISLIGWGTFLQAFLGWLARASVARFTGARAPYSVAAAATAHGVPVARYDRVNSADFAADLAARKVDAVLNVCSQIYGAKSLERLPPIYNFHGGYVPGNAGRFPLYHAYIRGLKQVLTCHRVTAEIDAGPPLLHVPLASAGERSIRALMLEMIARFPEVVGRAMGLIERGETDTLPPEYPPFYGERPTRSEVRDYHRMEREK